MRFVHNNHFRAGTEKIEPVSVRFDIVKGDDGEGIFLEQGCGGPKAAFQPVDRGRQNRLGSNMELVRHFTLPLLGKLRWTQDSKAANFSPVQQLTDNKQRLHCFADTYVISNEETDNWLAHGHEQGHKLVGSGSNRDMAE